jgi:hypothetical protein
MRREMEMDANVFDEARIVLREHRDVCSECGDEPCEVARPLSEAIEGFVEKLTILCACGVPAVYRLRYTDQKGRPTVSDPKCRRCTDRAGFRIAEYVEPVVAVPV